MKIVKILRGTLILMTALVCGLRAEGGSEEKIASVMNTPDLVAFWTFQEEAGQPRLSLTPGNSFPLEEREGPITRIAPPEGAPFGPYATKLYESQCLLLPREKIGALDIHGKEAQLSLIAWIKRGKKEIPTSRVEAIAGIWDMPSKLQQYCLFLNVKTNKNHPDKPITDKVGGLLSDTGGPPPGSKFTQDAAISKSSVPYDEWVCVGMTYDGKEIRAYLDGICEKEEGYNPYPFTNGIYDAGEKGADFKVGISSALNTPKWSWFVGTIGGIAVFKRALTSDEMEKLALPTLTLPKR